MFSIKQRDLYPTSVYVADIYEAKENEEYKKFLINLSKTDKGKSYSNKKGYQSDSTLVTEKIFEPLLEKSSYATETIIKNITGQDALDDSTQEEVIEVVKKLVQMMEDASSMVDFFNKEDEIRNVRREIRRTIMMTSFDDENLRKIIMEEFMELAKVKFQ